ncbi:MAG TPA: hypothetical protein VGC41_16280, partial [Kofleriaceae bacterium]
MQLLEDLPRPWRYIALALCAIGVFFILRWVDQPDPSDSEAEVEIHVKATHLTGGESMLHGTWWKIHVPASAVDAELELLASDPDVTEAYVVPVYSLPNEPTADACPIHTPSYSEHQGYLDPAPAGIDAAAMWRANSRGQGVWFADVEGGWNAKHEDLPGERIAHVFGKPVIDASWRAHGTAVLGEVVGRDNAKGITGIAPDTERVFTASICGEDVADT